MFTFAKVSSKPALAAKPILIHHPKPAHFPASVLLLEARATDAVSCKVVTTINRSADGLFSVLSAVQYADGDVWYQKGGLHTRDLSAALRAAYQATRYHFKVTASRALAGQLFDSVVPATDDIDC